MSTFTEDDLQITFTNVVSARKFDGLDHGLSHCMKAVDFIVELPDHYLYIEFKDPQNPAGSDPEGGAYLQRFKKGQIDEDLKYKYRDSFLYGLFRNSCGLRHSPRTRRNPLLSHSDHAVLGLAAWTPHPVIPAKAGIHPCENSSCFHPSDPTPWRPA